MYDLIFDGFGFESGCQRIMRECTLNGKEDKDGFGRPDPDQGY